MVYSLRLDIGMPAILVFICIELLTRFSFRLHYKLIIITLFLITVQGLMFAGHDKIGIWKWM